MAIKTEELETQLEKVERALMNFGAEQSVRRVSHNGASTSREVEYFAGLSRAELVRQKNYLLKQLGRPSCSNRPLYPR